MGDDVEVLRLRAMAKAKADREREQEQQGQNNIFQNQNPIEADVKAAVGKGLQTLDWPAGIVRTGAAKVLEQTQMPQTLGIQPQQKIVTDEDVANALKGPFGKGAPLSSTYLQRTGMDPSTAGRVGFMLDAMTDPFVLSEATSRPFQSAAAKGGKALYKSGVKSLDIEAAKYGKEPVSDVLFEKGIVGNYEQIHQQMDELANQYLAQRNEILARADKAGGRVSMKDSMAPLQERINQIRATKDPNLQGIADTMQNDLNKYLALDQPPNPTTGEPGQYVIPSQASGFKSSEYNKIGDEAYNEAVRTPVGKSLQKTKAQGLREQTEKAVKQSLGDLDEAKVKEINDKLGRILTTQEKAQAEAAKEIRKNNITPVDTALAMADWKTALAKKIGDITKATGPRTKVGMGLYERSWTPMLPEKTLLYSPWPRLPQRLEEGENQ